MQNLLYQRFSKEEMEIARQTDLPDLLASLGYHVTVKGRFHSTKEMDSLMIKNRRSFVRYSEQVRGDAITFLQRYHNMTFENACNYLLNFNGYSKDNPIPPKPRSPDPPKEEIKPKFRLPEPYPDNHRVYAYLQARGISQQVIGAFISSGLLYEDKKHRNCVFVGFTEGKAAFAFQRGTIDRNGSGFKGDVPGSDKSVAFSLPADPVKNTVHVFESPLDLISYQTLHRNLTSNAVALCCLHDGALERYLAENPHVKTIILCLDADHWGERAAFRIAQKYSDKGYAIAVTLPPSGVTVHDPCQFETNDENTEIIRDCLGFSGIA